MWAVLRTMGIPKSIINVVQLHYHQLVTQILCKRPRCCVVPHCLMYQTRLPLVGHIVCLVDPLIRDYLLEITLRSSVIFAFADNLGLVMLNVFLQLPVILNIFALWAAATVLRLKGPKCVLVLLIAGYDDICLPWISDLPVIAGPRVAGSGIIWVLKWGQKHTATSVDRYLTKLQPG